MCCCIISLHYTRRTHQHEWIRAQRRHPQVVPAATCRYQLGQLVFCLAGWTGRSSLTAAALLIVLCEELLLHRTVTEERAGPLIDPADVPWVGGSQLGPTADQLVQTFSNHERRKAHNLHSVMAECWKAPHGLKIHVWQMERFTSPPHNEAVESVCKKKNV